MLRIVAVFLSLALLACVPACKCPMPEDVEKEIKETEENVDSQVHVKKSNMVKLETNKGDIVIELDVDLAPVTTANFLQWIEIDGLEGAEHWVWHEAENARTDGSGGLTFKNTTKVSNYHGSGVNNAVDDPFSRGHYNWQQFQFYAPADMANARFYLRYGANNPTASDSYVLLDGQTVGGFCAVQNQPSGYDPIFFWASGWEDEHTKLGTVSQGVHSIHIYHDYYYCFRSYDGFLIYNGEPEIHNETFDNDPGSGTATCTRPPSSANSAIARSVGYSASPVINLPGFDADLHSYKITLNGADFTSGTVIEEPGYYELVVLVEEKTAHNVIAFAGANFRIGEIIGTCSQAGYYNENPTEKDNDPREFALGWYCPIGDSPVEIAALGPFNATAPYGRTVEHLTDAAQNNVGVFQLCYEGPLRADHPDNWPATLQDLIDAINQWKVHPAVWYWNVYDEPINGQRNLQDFADSCNAIRAADPNRMVTSVFCMRNLGPWLDPLDFAMFDIYPMGLPGSPSPYPEMYLAPRQVLSVAIQSREKGKLPPIYVGPAGGPLASDGTRKREPDAFENRYLTFAPVTVGARGILWYIYHRTTPTHRAEIAVNSTQLKELVPAIQSAQGNGGISVSSNNDFFQLAAPPRGVNNITYLFRKLTEGSVDNYYMLATNNSGTDLTGGNAVIFTFDGLPSGNYTAEVLHESRSVPLIDAGGGIYTLTDDFPNYDVNLYKIVRQ